MATPEPATDATLIGVKSEAAVTADHREDRDAAAAVALAFSDSTVCTSREAPASASASLSEVTSGLEPLSDAIVLTLLLMELTVETKVVEPLMASASVTSEVNELKFTTNDEEPV